MKPGPALFAPDHIVVAAASLAAGAAWCEAEIGVAPQAGGRHVSMATHNLLLDLSSPRFPQTYLEIIAIDPLAVPTGRPRWFDLDAAWLRDAVASGPRLVHWVARTADIDAAAAALRAAGHDPGPAVAAERMTPGGLLRWRILVRDDGQRLAAGAVPLVIEWGGVHPTVSLPASGVALEDLRVAGIDPALAAALGVRSSDGGSPLAARLTTPRGSTVLEAPQRAAAGPG